MGGQYFRLKTHSRPFVATMALNSFAPRLLTNARRMAVNFAKPARAA